MDKTADVMQRFLRQEDREQTAKEQEYVKPPTEEHIREQLLTDISGLTGISPSQIKALPKDVQEDIVEVYSREIGVVGNSELADRITSAINGKPPENHLKTIEELVEGNANSIDGVINNLPPETENEHSEKKLSLEERIMAAREKSGQDRETQSPNTPERER